MGLLIASKVISFMSRYGVVANTKRQTFGELKMIEMPQENCYRNYCDWIPRVLILFAIIEYVNILYQVDCYEIHFTIYFTTVIII